MIQATLKGKDIKVIIWAAFWGSKISDLYPLKRDFEAKKIGYSTNFYLDVLNQSLTQFYEPSLIFI